MANMCDADVTWAAHAKRRLKQPISEVEHCRVALHCIIASGSATVSRHRSTACSSLPRVPLTEAYGE